MMLDDGKLAIFPAVNRSVAVAVLINESDVLKDVPLLIVRLENRFMLIHLPQTCSNRVGVEIPATALQLMPPEGGFHHTTSLVPGLTSKELIRVVVFFIGPPTEAVAALSC